MLSAYVLWIGWYDTIVEFLHNHQLTCPSKKYFGIECPGCGLQRSFIYLLEGRFTESLQTYPALLPMLAMFVFLALHLKFKFRHGALVLKCLFILCSVIILAFYIYKQLNHISLCSK